MSTATPPADELAGRDKRALLAELLRKRARAPKSYPLSFSQQRLWFIDQLDGGNPAYNMGSAIRLAGALDRPALARSLKEIVRRHAAIRTTFTVADDSPRQIVVPIDHPLARAAARLPLIDLRALPPAEQATTMRRLTNQLTWQPFDLVRGPLLRCALIALDDDVHVLLITIYHIIADGWSMGVLIRELVTLYAAFAARQPTPLPELPIQYADYAVWQRESLQGELVERQLAYWRAQLAGLSPLDLPTDRPRPLVQRFQGGQQRFICSVPLTAALTALGQQAGATLFMVLLAAYQTLLARYSGQDDIVVGSPIANRTRVELEGLIGVFVNMLALRADLSGNPTFRTLLGRVRELTFDAYAHQDLPFEQLVEQIQPERDLSRTPLFQVIFVLQNSPMPAAELHGMVITIADIDIQTSRFDLGLSAWETANGLEGGLEYSTALFDATTITRMLHHFDTLLAAIVAQPDQRLADLPLLNDAERQQILVDWNDTIAGVRGRGDSRIARTGIRSRIAEAHIHQLFVAQSERTPDMIAAVFENTHLTYAELNRSANRLAHELRALGVGPDVLVGLCVERSLALVIGLLGIFKAGGAYVPLDPAYPPERLAFMLADARVSLLITDSIYDLRLTIDDLEESQTSIVNRKSKIVNLDVDWPRIAQRSAANPTEHLSPDNLAYMIYTSGSTGQPKGVLVPHRGLGNLARVKLRACAVEPGDRQLQFASFSFDAVISEIVTALPWGATLCLARRESLLPGPALTELLRDYAITTVALPPSALMILVPDEVPGLRTITVAGEASSADLIARWAPGRRIINGYGPTEGTVGAAMNICRDNGQPPPIGRPIANTQLYLLDRHMRPAAIGVPGELYIQGVGLARGYHNRPDLTAERFVPNPFAEVSGIGYRVLGAEPSDTRYPTPDTRLYKTGDLARYRPDGSIMFLRRIDDQVKLRGFRIELREIETALRQHESVREAVALVREDVAGDQRLVAYVVPTKDDRTDAIYRVPTDESGDSSIVHRPSSLIPDLRAFLAARLPDYMLPSAFVLLDALPRTPNGKLDRRALPAPAQTRDERDSSFVAPRTPVEELLARIWEQILGVAPIGSADNFFALGGHSLLATQVIARVRQMLHVELPVRALFEAPTVGGLAEQVERERRTALGLDILPLRPIPHTGPVPLSFAQQRLWFLDQLVPNSPFYNVPTAVQLDGALDLPALAYSLNGVVQRHEALRTTFAIVDGQPAQLIAAALHLPLPLIDLQATPAEQRQALAMQLVIAEAKRPFDLVRGPLVRALLLRLGATEHLLFLAMHHIISDGWSIGVLIGEVAALYAARVLRQPATLPALPIQYADFSYWQREWLQGAILATQMAYWKRQLGAQPPVLALPTDRPRPAFQTFRGARQRVRVPIALTEALLALSHENGTTLFMTLLAAFQTLLARYSGQHDIIVGAPIANRTRAELEPLIGFFVNTLVLRGDLSGDPSFRELLARVRESTLDAHDHQDLPFEKLVEELQPNRDPSRNPLFQVMFVLQNAPMPALTLPNLTLQPIEAYNGTAKFDLWLGLGAGPDGLAGSLEYNVDLFDATTILRLRAHLLTLLAGVTANPQRRLADLPLLTAPEQQQVIAEWNDTRSAYAELCVHSFFEMQVARTPDAVAVVFGNDQVSYAELDRRANQLAQHLHCLGATVGTTIAICMDRSLELIIGLLGILKVGAAYVPLDPASPPQRLAFMLADSQAPVLITDSIYDLRFTIDDLAESQTSIVNRKSKIVNLEIDDLEESHTSIVNRKSKIVNLEIDDLAESHTAIVNRKSKIVNLSADWPMIARQPAISPASDVTAGHLGYVIYTSGSTGKPKGVAMPHRALVNLLVWQQPYLHHRVGTRFLQFASLSFDVSYQEIFPTLASGGVIVLITEELRRDAPALWRLLAAQHAERIYLPYVGLQQLAEAAEQPGPLPRQLREITVSGEQLQITRAITRMFQILDGATLHNFYGPSESHAVTAQTLTGAPEQWPTLVPIGRPIANSQMYILDRQLRPVAAGLPGELYIGGDCLADGYLHRPDLTAERFVPNPWGSGIRYQVSGVSDRAPDTRHPAPATRLYKTGDLARYRPDGSIEFLGRIDDQIKIRGFRVELEEIAAVLRSHAAVQKCAVIVREDIPGDKRLVAYVVPTKDDRTDAIYRVPTDESPDSSIVDRPSSIANELRAYLKPQLPDYMLPSAFVLLDALPLTLNGKVDHKALPSPDLAHSDLAEAYVAPRTPIEEVVVGIWADVLGMRQIGVEDNFFALGGHSLLATQVIARLREAFQVELPVRALFEAPTPAGLAERITTARRDTTAQPVPPIQRMARDGALPLSFAQQRLWFLDQLLPNSPLYNIPITLRLTGTLHVAALRYSLNVIVQRHEALRTTFVARDDQPIQEITAALRLALLLLDLQAYPAAQREAVMLQLARVEARLPFDLARGPLIRARLLRLAPTEHVLLLTLHHIIADGWSMGVLVGELTTLYDAFVRGASPALPMLPVQYADFALWQRGWLQGALLATQLTYWRRQLADLPALNLPTDRPRPALATFRGARQPLRIPEALTAQLLALSRQTSATLFMTLLAAFQTVLARTSGQTDIPIGAPIANRTWTEIEGLIGFFVNTLVLRADLSGNPSFRELLGQVREVTLEAHMHQDLPFEKLVEELQPVRDPSRNPLFQVMLVLQNTPVAAVALPGLTFSPVEAHNSTAKFDLWLGLGEGPEGLRGAFEYNTDLFEHTTITRLRGHLLALLAGVVADPTRRLSELPLLHAAERSQLINEWNDTVTAYPTAPCIHTLFEAQAARTPDAVAVAFDSLTKDEGRRTNRESDLSSFVFRPSSFVVHLTYRELNRRASQLAQHLQSLGVVAGMRVGICTERSLEMIVGLLGILKAGAAYVPLDPASPPERLAFMLADARVAVLITRAKDERRRTNDEADHFDSAIVNRKSKIVNLDADWPSIARQPATLVDSRVTANHLGYVIYTSGSTGSPKGVAMSQRALVNLLHWQLTYLDHQPGTRFLQFASLSFDVSYQEIFPTLASGGVVVLITEALRRDAWALWQLLARERVERGYLPYVGLQQLAEAATPQGLLPHTLRQVTVSGEQLQITPAIRGMFEILAGAVLHNFYGPSESHAISAHTLRGTPQHWPTLVPIGRPIANAQLYVLDAQLRVVPLGAVGELYIGGVGLADGYLGRPDLTAERFVPNPFAEMSGIGYRVLGAEPSDTRYPTPDTRLYKTGDLARYLPDGSLMFLGRSDGQVKLRGYRVELDEIAAVLAQHAAVQECVVLLREDRPAEPQLVAYVVPTEDEGRWTMDDGADSSFVHRPSSFVSDLRSFLKQQLPEYMQPAAFVLLERLPLTINRKVDRKALPAPEPDRHALERAFEPPQTPLEHKLATIWSDVLHAARVGRTDNFFELGGHSLLATQVISRVRQHVGLDLPLRTLFELPTIAGMAERIEALQLAARHLETLAATPIDDEEEGEL